MFRTKPGANAKRKFHFLAKLPLFNKLSLNFFEGYFIYSLVEVKRYSFLANRNVSENENENFDGIHN